MMKLDDQHRYLIKSRIWICTDQGTFLGEGRVSLLKQIDEFGSISKAAKSMKMSYKKAWDLVNSMNSQSGDPLVERTIGGNGGGGTVLTDAGRNAIKIFEKISSDCRSLLKDELAELKF